MPSRIEDYGFIGNTRTAALVSSTGGLDWLCCPRFDSEACFAALLGTDEHGTWSVAPSLPVRERRQRYRDETLILETEVICDGGAVRLIDFMPIGERSEVIRVVEGVAGEVPMRMVLAPRFGYGAYDPWVTRAEDGWRFVCGPDALVARGPVTVTEIDGHVVSEFTIRPGQRIGLTLTWHASHEPVPSAVDAEEELRRCEQLWRRWSGRCTYRGEWRDAVVRSLITLKGLAYAPTGAIVAAPTLGLPEELGGGRNWDYRFCWIRDATLTLHALMLGGYLHEAYAFRDWLMRAAAGGPPSELQIMYDLEGSRRLTEFELPWLPGYEGSRPVRAGNAAYDQFQLDVYGELLGAVYQARQLGLEPHPESFRMLDELVRFVADAWQEPDDGIWEVRGGRRHFTHSKVMAWVAADRAARLLEETGDERTAASLLGWARDLRARIHEDILQHGFDPELNALTQSYGSKAIDASILLIPRVGFLSATDPRMLGTVEAVERTLVQDGVVHRYRTDEGVDGLAGSEGAFLACSFWLCDNYALAGKRDQAEALFERLLALRTPLGLLSEEYDPGSKRLIGNFPQGFSHLALISSANTLSASRRAT
jgi:GH15 family glucan-1,4-alpha-glucosidase